MPAEPTKETAAIPDEKLGDFAGVFDAKEETQIEPEGQRQLAGTETDSGESQAGDATAQQTSEPSLLDRIRSEYGIEADDEQAALTQLVDQYGQARQYINNSHQSYGQQLEELRRQNNMLIEALQQGRQPPQQAIQQTQPEPQSQWRRVKPLEVSEAVIRTFRDTTTGGWKENTPPQVIQEAERYQGELGTYFDQLATNPDQVLGPGMRAIAREVISEVFGMDPAEIPRRFDPRVTQQQSAIEQQWVSLQPVLFERIPNTNQLDFNVPTPIGSQFFGAMQQAEQMIRQTGREPAEHEAFQLAIWRMGDQLYQQQRAVGGNGQQVTQKPAPAPAPAPQPTAEQIREDRRRQHMRQQRAASVTTAGGTTQGGNVGQPERTARKQNPLLGVGDDFAKSLYGENPGFNMGQ